MINFWLGSTTQFIKCLEAETLRFKTYCVTGSGNSHLSDDDAKRLEIAIKEAHSTFDEMKNTNIDACIKELEKFVAKKIFNIDIHANLHYFAEVIQVALSERLYYAYPIHKAAVFYNWKDEWEQIYSCFDESVFDIWHGVDCWAMGQDTASVFHMMRVLEFGLEWLAKDVEVNMGVENWHNILDQIEKRIRETANTLPRGAEKSSRLQFLSEAAKEFRYFKDGWRNYVSHGRGIYDEYQARSVLEHVKSFMLTLAKAAKDP